MLSKITIVNNSRSGHEDVPKTHQEELCRSKPEKVPFSIGLSSKGDLLLRYSYSWYKHAMGIFHLMLSNYQVN